jgi:hypothetical protein
LVWEDDPLRRGEYWHYSLDATLLEQIQLGLDGLSLALDATGIGATVSWAPDVINALVSAVQLDGSGFFLSSLGALPYLGTVGNSSRIARFWGRIDTLAGHFARHGADFGARTAEEYAGLAANFFRRSQLDGLPTKIDSHGIIRVYDPATNTFGAFNPDGTTKTFFKPLTGAPYWDLQ